MSYTVINADNAQAVLLENTKTVVLGVFADQASQEFLALIPEVPAKVFAVAVKGVALPDVFEVTKIPSYFQIPVGQDPVAFDESTTLTSFIKSM